MPIAVRFNHYRFVAFCMLLKKQGLSPAWETAPVESNKIMKQSSYSINILCLLVVPLDLVIVR